MCSLKRLLLFCIVLLSAQSKPVLADIASMADIVSTEGTCHFRDSVQSRWQVANSDQSLFEGNYVRTGSHSRMGLLFIDQTQIRLHEKTLLRIKSVNTPQTNQKTHLFLERGRAWTRSKRVPEQLILETRAATAAIRGTDWDLEVTQNDSAIITVLSGEVEFFNPFGRLIVRKNEQALAVPGKAPVKREIIRPDDRVQWVNAYEVNPLRFIRLASEKNELSHVHDRFDAGDWQEASEQYNKQLTGEAFLGRAFVALRKKAPEQARHWLNKAAEQLSDQDERITLGRISAMILDHHILDTAQALIQLISHPSLKQPAAFLILAEIYLFEGERQHAEDTILTSLDRFPDHPMLLSKLAEIYLLGGEKEQSYSTLHKAEKEAPESIDVLLTKGKLARLDGNLSEAVSAYNQTISLYPADDRGWFGAGLVKSEREDIKPARYFLQESIRLNSDGLGYQGELGTLETFANNFASGQMAFQQALSNDSDDYIALAGMGLLWLKQGKTDEAMTLFLKSGLMEPGYPRAHIYLALAYYQQEQVEAALEALDKASQLDDKDPVPHILASIIYTDLLRPAEALTEARQARKLMPYLKSLNQLANTQRGTTNLGQAFAFMGLTGWAQNYAQQTYYPYWAGSHLFLANRYHGLFNKNSELYQGFLTDPVVFGSSNRFQTLSPKPVHNFSASYRISETDTLSATSPAFEVSGFDNAYLPASYYLAYEGFDLDFDAGPNDIKRYTGALGINPRHDTGLFLFHDTTQSDSAFNPDNMIDLNDQLVTHKSDIGFSYKFSPESQLWLKAGSFYSEQKVAGALTGLAVTSEVDVEQPEYNVRYSFRVGDRHEITWGADLVQRETRSLFTTELDPSFPEFITIMDFDYQENSVDIYLADHITATDSLTLEGALFYQNHNRKADYRYSDSLFFPPPQTSLEETQQLDKEEFNLRAGLTYQHRENILFRLAGQSWLRPSSFGTLGPVATAGMPLDDRMVQRGGKLERYKAQLEWEFSEHLFSWIFADYRRINNHRFDLTPFSISDIENLAKLRSREMGALSRDDLLEFITTPDYEKGVIRQSGIGINSVIGARTGVFSQYRYTSSQNTGSSYRNNKLPYLPRHTFQLGSSWIHPDGWYLIGQMIYRTERFSDEANTARLKPGWDGAIDLYWQSPQKHWLFRISVDEIMDRNQPTQYTAEINYRY